MSGKIIWLRHRRGLDRAAARRAQLNEQVVRILSLLCELEALTLESNDVPRALLERARVSIDKTDSVLQALLKPTGESADDPQPNVDNALLERMYRALDLPA
jgi:hypothetical protein